MALTIQQFKLQIRTDNIPYRSKFEVIYPDKILEESIFSKHKNILEEQKHLLENSFTRFSGGVTMDIPILDFLGQHTDSILKRGRDKYISITLKNALLNTNLNFRTVEFPVINRRFT